MIFTVYTETYSPPIKKNFEYKSDYVLIPDCRSVLSPNIYNISINEIETCDNENDCEVACFRNSDPASEEYDFDYRVLSEIIHFQFTPLEFKPIEIEYSPQNGSVIIDGCVLIPPRS